MMKTVKQPISYKILTSIFIIFITIFNGSNVAYSKSKEVTIYTKRHYSFDKKIYNKLFKEKGIKINIVKSNANQLISRLIEEGDNSPADLFMSNDAGALYKAKENGLLYPINSKSIEIIPSYLKDSENYWVPVTKRSRVIVYSKDRVKKSELSTYEDLASPKWKNKILVRSSSNVYNQSLLSSIIASLGNEKAKKWAMEVRNNMARPPQGGDRDQILAIYSGIGDIALVNTYYIGVLSNSQKKSDRKAADSIGVFFPNQDNRGSHVNVSGIGIVKSSKNKALAKEVIEFFLSKEIQELFPNNTYEYPVHPDVKWSIIQKKWGNFKSDKSSLEILGKFNSKAVDIFNESNWE